MAEKWSLKGAYAGVCNCNSPCPCIFGRDPTRGNCGAILCFNITAGSFGSVGLSGRKLGLAFTFPGNPSTPARGP